MSRLIRLLAFIIASCTISGTHAQPVEESRFVSIGGIDQWITISGDKSKPLVLFIHGGPGSVMSPYDSSMLAGWRKDFVIAHWDQRGAGRTFGKNAPVDPDEDYWIENPLTLTRMADDGIEVAEFLTARLGKSKLILVGTSWGSVLGTRMVLKRPDLFHAYIGHAQIISISRNMAKAYEKTSSLAHAAGDTSAIGILNSLGPPPYGDARKVGRLLRVVKDYERQNAKPPPAHWAPAPEYDNETDEKHRYNGDDYSFLYLAGHEKLGIKPMALDTDLMKDGLQFSIPVFLVNGEHDILSATTINREWFNAMKAPAKEYHLVPDAAHGFNEAVMDKIYRVLKKVKVPE